MSFTANDIQILRQVIREEHTALESDIKEIYRIISKMGKDIKRIARRVDKLEVNMSAVANHTGATLPYS